MLFNFLLPETDEGEEMLFSNHDNEKSSRGLTVVSERTRSEIDNVIRATKKILLSFNLSCLSFLFHLISYFPIRRFLPPCPLI